MVMNKKLHPPTKSPSLSYLEESAPLNTTSSSGHVVIYP